MVIFQKLPLHEMPTNVGWEHNAVPMVGMDAPPSAPEVLVLSDEMMDRFQGPDKYMHCLAMMGYDMPQYAEEIAAGLINVKKYRFVIVFLGTMQIGRFEPNRNLDEMTQLMEAITGANTEVMILFSSLLPRPIDWPRSRNLTEGYSRSIEETVQKLHNRGFRADFVNIYSHLLNDKGGIYSVHTNFVDQLYLSQAGIRSVRALWLRHLGYFPAR